MEWRTKYRLNVSFAAIALLTLLPGVGSAGIKNPNEEFPVSRFGQSLSLDDDQELPVRDRLPAADKLTVRSSGRTDELRVKSMVRRHGVQEVALIAGDLGFFPRTVFVTQDIPVRLFVTGASKNSLCIMMDAFSVRKQVRSQQIEEIAFTPDQPGRFRFYCPVNGAEGFVVVREFARGEES
jgi:hypothetical protein